MIIDIYCKTHNFLFPLSEIYKTNKNLKNIIVVQKLKNLRKDYEHVWQFSRVGGVNRVNLTSGKDLMFLDQLDQKLWTALSCPVSGLEIDSQTLKLIDENEDGRIRVPEVITAVKWITSVIKNPDDLLQESSEMPLAAINDATDEGKILLSSTKQILANLGKEEAETITISDTSDLTGIFANTVFNGDGIIIEDSAKKADLKELIIHIINTIGSVEDRSGKLGISADHINDFYQQCEDYIAWQTKAEENKAEILPFGDTMSDALAAFEAIRSKVEDYFLRCKLAEYDPSSTEVISLLTPQYTAMSSKNLSDCTDEISELPIAKMSDNMSLPLYKGINPAWSAALTKFTELVIEPLFPKKKEISEKEWIAIAHKFDAYTTWLAEKQGAVVESLGLDVIQAILENNKKDALLKIIEQDLKYETEANNILQVNKLVRFYTEIFTLLKNFVNFSDFYSPDKYAIFQAGHLYIDQRRCDLCIEVNDMPKHGTMAGFSDIYLIYCDCVSKKTAEKMTIVAALTDGDSDSIMVGRNAVFYDRKGDDWDAIIVKIIENPVSIKEAFWSPYKKLARFVNEQIEKFASSKEDAMTENLQNKVTTVGETSAEATTTGDNGKPAAAFDIGKFAGIFAALSLAIAAIGTALMSVAQGFMQLTWWQIPLVIIGVMLLISLPSMILAYLKLRKRNLASVLDANGWAINARLTVNIVFGRTLTQLAALPRNSKLNLSDPYKKKKKPIYYFFMTLLILIGIALIIGWSMGLLEGWMAAVKAIFVR